jgi:ferric-dicitrate binding protein FerR (iron transport regulator)
MMTEQEFDTLWQRAAAAPHATRLLEEYPVWHRNRQRRLGAAALLVAVAAVALPLLTLPQPAATDKNHTAIYCNRPDITDQYWDELADALLMEA